MKIGPWLREHVETGGEVEDKTRVIATCVSYLVLSAGYQPSTHLSLSRGIIKSCGILLAQSRLLPSN
jgi:hypothetical protein